MIGATDKLDRALVKVYMNVKTVNLEANSTAKADDVLNAMSMVAMANKAFINFRK